MSQNAGVAIAIMLGLVVAASAFARRALVMQRLRYGVALCLFAYIAYAIAQPHMESGKALLVATFAALVLGEYFRPKHSRYIRTRDRRRAIAEFERSGEKYNPRKHEIDHVVPYSRGGGNTSDNLKVIAKAKNRAKSDRSPWWDVFG